MYSCFCCLFMAVAGQESPNMTSYITFGRCVCVFYTGIALCSTYVLAQKEFNTITLCLCVCLQVLTGDEHQYLAYVAVVYVGKFNVF